MCWDNKTLSRFLSIGLWLIPLIYGGPLQADGVRAYGLGRETCERYLEARENAGFAEVTYKSWISGYLSARRGAGDAVFCDAGFASVLMRLDDYCQQHRQQTLFSAMQQLSTGTECPVPAE